MLPAETPMADQTAAQRAKLTEMFAFWGWRVRPEDVRLEWHIEAELSLAVWSVWRSTPDGMRKSWAITEPSGTLPIDHLPADGVATYVEALREFGERWRQIAAESLEKRIGEEHTGRLRRENPGVLTQAKRMRAMIGVAAELLLDLAAEGEDETR
jgi:hypothetical protein